MKPFVLVAVVGFIIVAAIAAVRLHSHRGAVNTPVTQQSVNREQFFVLAFPMAHARASPSSGPDAASVAIGRAILLSLDEASDSIHPVEVWVANKQLYLPRDQIAFRPPPNVGALVQQFNSDLASWGSETDWRKAAFRAEPAEGTGAAMVLSLTDKRGRTIEYRYAISSTGVITPISASVGRE